MAIISAYVRTPGKFKTLLGKLQTAGVPKRVTYEFLKTLGCKSSNDRMMIQVLKGIGFLDSNGVPTAKYREYRDPAGGPRLLAEALREAYEDLFLAHTRAYTLSVQELKGIVATKVSKPAAVTMGIAKTFKVMAEMADFSAPGPEDEAGEEVLEETPSAPESAEAADRLPQGGPGPSFHYNIEIHLPTTTDISVYNAIFKSLRENLL